jgi:hypothetical protein
MLSFFQKRSVHIAMNSILLLLPALLKAIPGLAELLRVLADKSDVENARVVAEVSLILKQSKREEIDRLVQALKKE